MAYRFGTYRTDRETTHGFGFSWMMFFFILFALLGWAWFFLGSHYFDAEVIQLQGIQSLERGEVINEVQRAIQEQAWRPWRKKNLLFLDTMKLQVTLRDRLFVDELEIDKSYPNILRLIIKERQRSVVLVSRDQYITVDASGVVTGEADGAVLDYTRRCLNRSALADQTHDPLIILNLDEPASTGFQVASREQVRKWLDVTRLLLLRGVVYRFVSLDTSQSATARFMSDKGYEIYLNIEEDLEPQLKTYLEYLKTKPKLDGLQYIDVRVPGKLFVK